MSEVSIIFSKGNSEKQDTVVIGSTKQKHVFKAWRQGIIPHEMVHYAVEKVFDDLRGFIRCIGDGIPNDEVLEKGGVEALYSEALVNTSQQELFGVLPGDNESFVNYFNEISHRETKFSKKKDFFDYVPSDEKIDTVRNLLTELTDEWNALPESKKMRFTLAL